MNVTVNVQPVAVLRAKELKRVVCQIEKVEQILVKLRERKAELLRELGAA